MTYNGLIEETSSALDVLVRVWVADGWFKQPHLGLSDWLSEAGEAAHLFYID